MRYLLLFMITLLSVAGLVSCGGEEVSSEDNGGLAGDTTTVASRGLNSPPPPPCPVEGELLPGNWRLVNRGEQLLAISADSTTYEAPYGASHRVLTLYDRGACTRLDRRVLPVNRAPDYAYQIAEIIYNNDSRLIAVKGFDVLYCYDIAERRLLPPLTPRFQTQRNAVDAQSGMIRRVEVWEDYLIGFARDYGAFVFDLRDTANPEPVMPFSEYETPSGDYASLFLLPSGDRRQLLLPTFDSAAGQFEINPLLEKPLSVSTNVPASALDNRFLVLRREGGAGSAIAVDMLQRRRVNLPPGLRTAPAGEILEWLRANVDG